MIYDLLNDVRAVRPLVHHITNWVTIYDCANITRMAGALPVMAHARGEAADMAGIASALVLNIGTLTPELVEAMILAGQRANGRGIPVVFDAVGVGATPLRNEKAAEILDSVRMAVIKGNASEIAKLAGEAAETRGVEATDVAGDRAAICGGLSRSRQAAVVMTGERDIVTDGRTVTVVKNGHPMMGRIVGTGCMAASVIGAFCAVGKDSAMSAVAALVCFEVAAELAAADAPGPGTFKVRLFDELFNLDRTHIERMAKIETGTA